jgi:hypothetical protein
MAWGLHTVGYDYQPSQGGRDMARIPRADLENMLLEVWEASKGNWTYGGQGADGCKSPSGWVIASDSAVMGRFKALVEQIQEG